MDGWDKAKPTPVGTENFDTWVDLDGSNVLVNRRIYGPDFDAVMTRQSAAGVVAWYLPDRQGSVRVVIDNSAVVQNSTIYTAFGEIQSGSLGHRIGYAGYQLDSVLTFYHDRSRTYDPGTGRFTSVDVLGFAAGDVNLYRYVGNSPTNATDPSGHELIVAGDGALSDVLWQIEHILKWTWPGSTPLVYQLPGSVKDRPAYLILPGPDLLVDGTWPIHEARGREWPNTARRVAASGREDSTNIFWSIGNPGEDRVLYREPDNQFGIRIEHGTASLTEPQRVEVRRLRGPAAGIATQGVPVSPLREDDTPGPEVTAWFVRDLAGLLLPRRQQWEAGLQIIKEKFPEDSPLATFALSGLIADDGYDYYNILANKMSYKWMPFSGFGATAGRGRGINTVTLAGRVVQSKQLGNFGFGLISQLDPPKILTPLQCARFAYGMKTGFPPFDAIPGLNPLQTHRYEANHPHAETYGWFKGELRSENLAWFGVGDEVAVRILKTHPEWWKLNEPQFAAEVEKHLRAVLEDKNLGAIVNRFNGLMEHHLGHPVTIGVDALYFAPEYGGFNTNSLLPKMQRGNVYPVAATSGEKYDRELRERYEVDRDAWRQQNIVIWVQGKGLIDFMSFKEYRQRYYENWTKTPGTY